MGMCKRETGHRLTNITKATLYISLYYMYFGYSKCISDVRDADVTYF